MKWSLFDPENAALLEDVKAKYGYTDDQITELRDRLQQAKDLIGRAMEPGFEPLPPVTVWFRWNEQGKRFDLNHIEDGHVPADQALPTPQCEAHKSLWARGRWKALPARLMPTHRKLRGPRVLYCDPVLSEQIMQLQQIEN